ncbi:MAG: hypothetical protein MJ163_01895 [Alphaproteobacteria bacterium]|nr:hypothetical protein [Alphaproteobacteria bacterium]
MKKFHRNLNIMSIFTAILLVFVLIFWRTFLNIAVTNVFLNGIIIGTTVFGIGLCFVSIFKLLPEYKWMHAYFDGRANYGFVPRLLRPISSALHNRHVQLSASNLTELLDLVSIRIEEERDSVRYITNTLIFLGLLGTFWGLIITVGGFAELLLNIDFSDETVLQTMQMGMAGPLSGMATAFTSSLLGLAGSLAVGFLGLQLQFAQNTLFQELTDFMSRYVLQAPGDAKADELSEKAPVDESTYTKISNMYDMFTDAGYQISDLIRINGKYPAIVAIGTKEKLYIATLVDDYDILQNVLKRIELCFADTLEGLHIDTHILCITNRDFYATDKRILRFENVNALKKYLAAHKNTRPTSQQEMDNFDAYAEYINTAITYLFKK